VEYPAAWPTFFHDLIATAQQGPALADMFGRIMAAVDEDIISLEIPRQVTRQLPGSCPGPSPLPLPRQAESIGGAVGFISRGPRVPKQLPAGQRQRGGDSSSGGCHVAAGGCGR
jgi:hypothetical protein